VRAAAIAAAATMAVALVLGGASSTSADDPPVPVAGDAYEIATLIARWGPRPAASAREARAHRLVRHAFRDAGLRVGVQEFRVPGHGRSRNVIGVYDTPRSCLRIVMAHTDSMPAGPGANDNASGVGVVTSLARRLRLIRPWCDVWLVATGAEERGYTASPDHLGALALARRARAHGARKRLRWALSLDEVGRDYPFWLRSPVSAPRSRVETELLAAAGRVGTQVSWVRDESTGNSDHREFQLSGLPGVKLGVGAGGEPCRHMACDRPSRLRQTSLVAARRMVAEALRSR
jgi:aminopeptidase YwaD